MNQPNSLHNLRIIRNDLLKANTIVCSPDVYEAITQATTPANNTHDKHSPCWMPYWNRKLPRPFDTGWDSKDGKPIMD